MVRPGLLLDSNFTIEVHGSLRQPMAAKCRTSGHAPLPQDAAHCRLGDFFSPTVHSSRGRFMQKQVRRKEERLVNQSALEFPVCRLNHLRPQFFTKCPHGEKNCTVFNGQRGVYVTPEEITSSLSWAAQEVGRLKNACLQGTGSAKTVFSNIIQ